MFKFWLPDFTEEVTAKADDALVMPILGSFAKQVGIDFSMLPPAGSFLDRMVEAYSCDILNDRQRYTSDEIIRLFKTYFLSDPEWAIGELIAVCGEKTLEYLGL